MTEQEVTSSPSSGQSPLDLSLIEEVMTGQKSPSLLDPPSRKRKLSSAAGSAEQERQNEKEARIASGTHLSGSSTPNSEGSGRLISDDESNPQSEGTNGAPQTAPQTIARKHEHLTSAIASQAQEHEVRRHEIGLQGVLIKDKVDMVVAHKREKSKRLTNENIQILERKQQTLGKSDNVTSSHDVQYLPTLKHVSYKPEPISKLDIVPLIGDVNDGTPPTPGHSTYGIGKGFKSLDMPSPSEGQTTYPTCGIGENFDNPELPADNPSVSTPDNRPCRIGSNINDYKDQPLAAEMLAPNYDSAVFQNYLEYPGGELPKETIDEFLRFFESQTGECSTSGQPNNSDSSVTVSSITQNVTPSPIDRNTRESSNVSVIASFRHSLNKNFSPMCQHTTLKQCWLTDFDNRSISSFDTEGNKKQTINVDLSFFRFAMTGGNKLLVTNLKKCINQILLPQNTVSTVFCTPYVPLDICVSHAGEILVTIIDTLNQNYMPRQSFVVKYTSSGQEVGRSQMFDQFGNRLILLPIEVSVNHGGDRVAVVNYTSMITNEHTSHLVMLNGNLKLVSRYINHGVSVSRDNHFNECPHFRITDVKFANDNNVLITESYSRSVQLLDNDCHRLRVLMSCQADIPLSLAVDVDGDVWITYSNRCMKIIRYQKREC